MSVESSQSVTCEQSLDIFMQRIKDQIEMKDSSKSVLPSFKSLEFPNVISIFLASFICNKYYKITLISESEESVFKGFLLMALCRIKHGS